jgi:hypothetical protein
MTTPDEIGLYRHENGTALANFRISFLHHFAPVRADFAQRIPEKILCAFVDRLVIVALASNKIWSQLSIFVRLGPANAMASGLISTQWEVLRA